MEMLTIEIPTAEDREKQKTEEVSPLVLKAQELEVVDLESYTAADEFRKSCRAIKKGLLEKVIEPPLSSANAHHKKLCAWRDDLLDPIDAAEKLAGRKMIDWKTAEDRKALMERERIQKEANKRAEDERIAKAAALQAEGRTKEAEAAISRPVVAAPVATRSAAPAKIKGMRDNWKFEIIDDSLIPREYLEPDTKRIGAHGKSMGKDANIPGVRFYNEPTIV